MPVVLCEGLFIQRTEVFVHNSNILRSLTAIETKGTMSQNLAGKNDEARPRRVARNPLLDADFNNGHRPHPQRFPRAEPRSVQDIIDEALRVLEEETDDEHSPGDRPSSASRRPSRGGARQ